MPIESKNAIVKCPKCGDISVVDISKVQAGTVVESKCPKCGASNDIKKPFI